MKPLILISLMLCLTGCNTLFTRKTPELLVPSSTNIVQVVVTNTVQREVWTTNRVELPGGVVSLQPVRDLVIEQTLHTNMLVQIQPAVWFTNITVSPALTGAIQTAGDLAPVPWGGLAGQGLAALLGIAAAGYNWFGKRKALKEAGVAQTTANNWASATKATVMGLEHVRSVALKIPGYTPEIDRQVMQVVQGIQVAAGIKPQIENLVANYTSKTTS